MHYINPRLRYEIIDNTSNKLNIVHEYMSMYMPMENINTLIKIFRPQFRNIEWRYRS